MLESLQHKRFTMPSASRASLMQGDMLLATGCYWCSQTYRNSEPIGNVIDNIDKRPCYIHV